MVTNSPYKLDHVTKPGYGEPVPIKRFGVYEPQADIDKCLDCPALECHGKCKPGERPKTAGRDMRAAQMLRNRKPEEGT